MALVRRLPWVALLRVALGLIFLAASWDKLLHPRDFAAVIRAYQLLPLPLVNPAAVLLPPLELLLGLLLLVDRLALGAATLANGLLLVFYAALVYNAARGINVACGCFSSTPGVPGDMAWYLVRDAGFLVLGLGAWWGLAQREKARWV